MAAEALSYFIALGHDGLCATTPIAPASNRARPHRRGHIRPYSPDAARKLETQKPERSWLLPSLGAAALLLIVLIVVGGFLLLSPKNDAGNTNLGGSNQQNVPPHLAITALARPPRQRRTMQPLSKQSSNRAMTSRSLPGVPWIPKC